MAATREEGSEEGEEGRRGGSCLAPQKRSKEGAKKEEEGDGGRKEKGWGIFGSAFFPSLPSLSLSPRAHNL